ncbi:spore coat protein, partial [Bacillus safensis]
MEQQNQQKIGNPQTPVPTTTNMNDRDFVTDLLSTEKYMTSGYNTAL